VTDPQPHQEPIVDEVEDVLETQDVVEIQDAVEVEPESAFAAPPAVEESSVEAELGSLAGGLDQAAIEELLLEQAPTDFGSQPMIEEIELAPLMPLDSDPGTDTDIGLLLEVPLSISVELGRTSLTIRDLLALGQGSILQLDRHAGEPVDVLVNGKRLARGEVVVIDEDFGIRVTEVVTPEERISGMGR
jgi:flagellar motor switch protein FliN/FliY